MSEELTKGYRRAIQMRAGVYRNMCKGQLQQTGIELERYDATLRAVEEERDDAKTMEDALIDVATEIVRERNEARWERDAALAQVKELQKKLAETQWRMAP